MKKSKPRCFLCNGTGYFKSTVDGITRKCNICKKNEVKEKLVK